MTLSKVKIVGLISGFFIACGLGFFLFQLELDPVYYIALLWLATIILFFIYGNKLIGSLLDKILPWSRFVTYRFFTQLLTSIAYSLVIVNVSYFLLKALLTSDPPTPEQLMVMNLWGVLVTIILISIYFGVHFLKAWRKSEIESERLQKENIRSELDALKNHLDPHFLFNNLNILSALIDKDPKMSKVFLDKFAEVYRFLLQSKGSELVTLSHELEFLESYMYLMQSRFGENVKLESNLNCDKEVAFLPPLTLQMLFENGIKHNVISKDTPLTFELSMEGKEYLVVKNNLNEKKTDIPSNKTGLINIMSRYKHFTDLKVIIENNGKEYIVKVPLIEIEEV